MIVADSIFLLKMDKRELKVFSTLMKLCLCDGSPGQIGGQETYRHGQGLDQRT